MVIEYFIMLLIRGVGPAQVVHLAEKHFGWRGNGTVLAWDAAEAVPYALDEENPPLYDHIIHDVFSGTQPPPPPPPSPPFQIANFSPIGPYDPDVN